MAGLTVLEQQAVIEYVVVNVQCRDCQRAARKDTWQAVCQLRQKVPHRRTFLYLEQLVRARSLALFVAPNCAARADRCLTGSRHRVTQILTNKAQKDAVNIQEVKEGIDFFFSTKQNGAKFAAFVASVVPTTMKESGRVIGISHHVGTSTTSFAVTIAPICRHDLVYLPKKMSRSMGGFGPLVLCVRVASALSLLCLSTLEVKELSAAAFFKHPVMPLQSEARLVEFTVLDVEPISRGGGGGGGGKAAAVGKGGGEKKGTKAMIEVALSADFGVNDNTHHVCSHLGGILQPGDLVLGYDLGHANISTDEDDLTEQQLANLPTAVLVKKKYKVGKHRRARQRQWKLRALPIAEPDAAPTKAGEKRAAEEREQFYQELEEEPDVRGQVVMYSTERQRRRAEARAAAAGVAAPAAEVVEVESEEDEDDAEAVLIPQGELMEYDSESEGEDDEEDVDNEAVAKVLDGFAATVTGGGLARPSPTNAESRVLVAAEAPAPDDDDL